MAFSIPSIRSHYNFGPNCLNIDTWRHLINLIISSNFVWEFGQNHCFLFYIFGLFIFLITSWLVFLIHLELNVLYLLFWSLLINIINRSRQFNNLITCVWNCQGRWVWAASNHLIRSSLHILRCLYSCRNIVVLVLILFSHCRSSYLFVGTCWYLLVLTEDVDDLVGLRLIDAEVPANSMFYTDVFVVHKLCSISRNYLITSMFKVCRARCLAQLSFQVYLLSCVNLIRIIIFYTVILVSFFIWILYLYYLMGQRIVLQLGGIILSSMLLGSTVVLIDRFTVEISSVIKRQLILVYLTNVRRVLI